MSFDGGAHNLDAEGLEKLDPVLTGSFRDQSNDFVVTMARGQQGETDGQVSTAGHNEHGRILDLVGSLQIGEDSFCDSVLDRSTRVGVFQFGQQVD